MDTDTVALATFETLCEFVRKELCERDALDIHATAFVSTKLLQRGQPYGYVFHVRGPRMLRTSAVWSMADDSILFYNSTGQRVKNVKLSESPDTSADHSKAA